MLKVFISRFRVEGDAMSAVANVVHSDPEIMSGEAVFVGTRVPIKNLFDYLAAGDSLEKFLHSFPAVTRQQATAALELAGDALSKLARPGS
jgi:uncharacterized protein (DUF433 family)